MMDVIQCCDVASGLVARSSWKSFAVLYMEFGVDVFLYFDSVPGIWVPSSLTSTVELFHVLVVSITTRYHFVPSWMTRMCLIFCFCVPLGYLMID